MTGPRPAEIPVARVAPPVAVLVLITGCAVLVGPLWDPRLALPYGDLYLYFPALYRALGHAWDPFVQAGTPLLPNPQAGWFWPPSRLLAWDFARGLPWFAWVHLCVAALATWAWARTRLGDTAGPVFAGLAYALSGPTWSLVANPDKLPAHALVPAALLGLTLLVGPGSGGRRAAGWSILSTAVAGTWLSGGVETTVMLAGILPAWAAFLPGGGAAPRGRLARVAWAAAGLLAGTALAGCLLVPFAAWVPETNRAGPWDPRALTERSTWPVDWLGWVTPNPFWSGDAERYVVAPGAEPRARYLRSLYGGLVLLPLGLAGLAGAVRDRSRVVAGAAVVAFAFLALGERNTLYSVAVPHVPGLSAVRYPEKWFLGTVAFQAWLVAHGWDDAARHPAVARRVVGFGGAGVLLLGIAGAVVTARSLGGEETSWGGLGPAASATVPVLPLLALGLLVLGAGSVVRIRPPVAASALLVLACADLVRAGWTQFAFAEARSTWEGSAVGAAIRRSWTGPGMPRVWDDTVHRRSGPPPARDPPARLAVMRAVGFPDLLALEGVAYVDGMRAIATWRHERYIVGAAGAPPDVRRRMLRVLGADFWIVWDPAEAAALARDAGLVAGVSSAGTGLPVTLLREPDPLPRLRWVPALIEVPDGKAAVAALQGLDPTRAGIVIAGDRGTEALAETPRGDGGGGISGPTAVTEAGAPHAGRWEVSFEAPGPGALVLQEVWAPGWRFSVDGGGERPAARVDYLLVGAPAPAGRHRVVFRYVPEGLAMGVSVSVAAAFGALGVALWLMKPGVPRPVAPLRGRRALADRRDRGA